MSGKRDNAYWLGRLEGDHPAIHARLKAGEIKSVRRACAEAGLIHLPTRLDALKREWHGATAADRKAFLRWAKAEAVALTSAPRRAVATSLVGADGKLTSDARDRVRSAMSASGVKQGR